jgi:hypothetical protein
MAPPAKKNKDAATPNKPSAPFKPTSLTDNTGGTVSSTLAATAVEMTQLMAPLQLADIANSAAYAITIPFNFTLVSALWRTGKPATTGSKLATLTLSTTGGSLTGGVMALTSANQTPAGATVAATAISGANATQAAGSSIILTGSSVTSFVEGDGVCELTLINNDLANTLSSLASKINKIVDQL